jgi:hypothetical protein
VSSMRSTAFGDAWLCPPAIQPQVMIGVAA